MKLDDYGFPDLAVANEILAQMTDYGESRETLEKSWERWIHHLPFDTPVGKALNMMYASSLSKLDPERDKVLHHGLSRKQALLQSRIKRYEKARFLQGD